MKIHIKYLSYVLRHKWFVFVAGLKTGASIWRLIIHDWSKFLPSEWMPYAQYFNWPNEKRQRETNSAFKLYGLAEAAPFGHYVNDRFDLAWLLHQRRNKHHWQYWVLRNDDGSQYPLPMPEKYAREMVADWMGAGRAITGRWEVAEWYAKNKSKIQLHPQTEELVEKIIAQNDPKMIASPQ